MRVNYFLFLLIGLLTVGAATAAGASVFRADFVAVNGDDTAPIQPAAASVNEASVQNAAQDSGSDVEQAIALADKEPQIVTDCVTVPVGGRHGHDDDDDDNEREDEHGSDDNEYDDDEDDAKTEVRCTTRTVTDASTQTGTVVPPPTNDPVPTPSDPAPAPAPAPTSSGFTLADVQAHSTASDCWTAINGSVYDLTPFVRSHPGGVSRIIQICGIDGSVQYNAQHGGERRPANELADLRVGDLIQ